MSDVREYSLMEKAIALKVGEAIVDVIGEIEQPPCRLCNSEMDPYIEKDGLEELEPPEYYCSECDEIQEVAWTEKDKEAMEDHMDGS